MRPGNVQNTFKCLSLEYLLINIGWIICRTGRAGESFCEWLQLPEDCLQSEKQNAWIIIIASQQLQHHQMGSCVSNTLKSYSGDTGLNFGWVTDYPDTCILWPSSVRQDKCQTDTFWFFLNLASYSDIMSLNTIWSKSLKHYKLPPTQKKTAELTKTFNRLIGYQ